MKREIKFKVWDKYRRYLNSDYAINGNLVFGACEEEIIIAKEHLIFMQFTGLKDKNGIEIYEYDIIKSNQLVGTWTVVFHDGSFQLKGNNDADDAFGGRNTVIVPLSSNMEVIGNIYQNPELKNI